LLIVTILFWLLSETCGNKITAAYQCNIESTFNPKHFIS